MASNYFLHDCSSSRTMSSSSSPAPRAATHRSRPASRRTHPQAPGPSRPSAYHPRRQHARSTSLSPALPPPLYAPPPRSATPPPKRSRPMPQTTPGPEDSPPRFSRLFPTVLGSPFLATSDLPFQPDPMDVDVARPISPSPSVDFSIIDVDLDDPEVQFSTNTPIPGAYPIGRRTLSGMASSSRRATFASSSSSSGWPAAASTTSIFGVESSSPSSSHNPFKGILPRIWDVISSPGRAVLNFSPSANLPAAPSSRTPSPHPPARLGSWYLAEQPPVIPIPPPSRSSAKGKARAFFGRNGSKSDLLYLPDGINYSDLAPLDGEEGELIDDEACFIDVRAITGIDLLALLPPEIALHILIMLCPPPPPSPQVQPNTSHALSVDTEQNAARHAILACRAVSHTWRRLASDNAVWRALFLSRWAIDLRRAGPDAPPLSNLRGLGPTWSFEWGSSGSTSSSSRASTSTFGSSNRASKSSIVKGRFIPFASSSPRTSSSSASTTSTSTSSNIRQQHGQTTRTRSGGSEYSQYFSSHRISYIRPPPPNNGSAASPLSAAPLQLDWRLVYRERLELERRWTGTVPGTCTVPARSISRSSRAPTTDLLGLFDLASANHDDDDGEQEQEMECKENIRPWEPVVRRMEGHTDSVYCVEFDSQYVVTGSRDRTIKVWSLKTGQVLGTFQDAHRGSVLCLKFEKDWALGGGSGVGADNVNVNSDSNSNYDAYGDHEHDTDSTEPRPPKGLLVSGSSDCSICVWEMELGDVLPNGEREVRARVKATLEGHEGGVLDIRMDEKWIVSCSKDASIRVWDRKTLALSRVLRGHEGPVNAIGLQHDRVVSASGDGKLILWDVTNGERIRTFEGHDRGLACIEFKDNFIVSGSNDDKIKVWDPWTGECLRTLTGHSGLVRALSFDPRTGRLVSVSYDKTVKVWDFRTGKCVRDFGQVHGSHIFDVKFDAARIVTASHDHKIAELDFSVGLDASLFI